MFILNLILTAVCIALLFLTFNFKSAPQTDSEDGKHNFGGWILEKEPTCTEVGRAYRACEDADCTYLEWAAIPKKAHFYEIKPVSDREHSLICKECADETTEEHEFGNNGVCKQCGYVKENDDLKFTFNSDDNTYSVSGLNNSDIKEVIIPSVHNQRPVKRIAVGAFSANNHITSISIPDSITNIGDRAFENCRYLTSIIIPDSVTEIGNYAFSNSYITDITLPKNIKRISNGTFSGCIKLTKIIIPDGVTEIKDYAFNSCTALKEISIPDSVTEIGSSAFQLCEALQSITLPDGVTTIKSYTFNHCSLLSEINLPKNLVNVNLGAFYDCTSLFAVTLPDTVTTIGESAFNGCSALRKILIPSSVWVMGPNVFRFCYNLTIYCRTLYKPGDWNSNWNIDSCPVEWGYTGEL